MKYTVWFFAYISLGCSYAQPDSCSFTDREGGYTLDVPCNWKVQDHSRKNQMIRANFSRGKMGFQVRMFRNRDSLATFYPGYLKQFISDMEHHWHGEAEVLEESLGTRFYRTEIEMQRGDGKVWVFWEYLFENQGTIIVFQCGAMKNDREAATSVFNAIADSMEFVD